MEQDHYRTLGVSPTATAGDLRAAYLKLARANHPDTFTGADRVRAEARMQAINEAWNVVGVAHKRRAYDAGRPGSAQNDLSTPSMRRGRTHFRPFDDEPGRHTDVDLDPTPIEGSRSLPRWLSLAPMGLLVGGVPIVAFGTMVRSGGVIALGGACCLLGLASFFLLPLFAMSRAERDPYL